ncbi:MAG: nuclear transport factor 2 family protein [Calditrichaeota bacterium]|nr:MAG: nuclear transport factor 2 family protein [Calditrichota bacterium]MBL1206590.1 nuclear transport factor 2 family protein [Calditrichota bacterium]NOG46417.1 nuclear transport factor 2 family protein [Calditrichota bacterium]
MDIRTAVNDLNSKILQGKALDAFEEYYADNIVMQENQDEPTIGKEANRQREQEFFSSIKEFHGAEVKNVAISNNVSMVEWFWDYTHTDWGRVNAAQVAIQTWENGKIINEKFYYSK